MGLSKNHQCYIAVPSHIVNSHLQNMLSSEMKITPSLSRKFKLLLTNPRFWVFLVFLFGFVGLWLDFLPFSQNPCSISRELFTASEFWKQPDGLGYRPCLNFSKTSREILKDKTRYLIVVVSGGMNQQRNQIVDAVVIARILEAALVVPIFQVSPIWADESEFSDIFNLDHFKNVLGNDVRIVSSLPSTHVMTRPVEEKRTPLHASPQWIRSHYTRKKNIKLELDLLQDICTRFKRFNMSPLNPISTILGQNKLEGSNYVDWRRNLDIVLTAEEYKFVLHEECPLKPNDQSSDEDKLAYQKWFNCTS